MNKLLLLGLCAFISACASMNSDLNLDFTSEKSYIASLEKVENSLKTAEEKKKFEQGMNVITYESTLSVLKETKIVDVGNLLNKGAISNAVLREQKKSLQGKSIKDVQARAADGEKLEHKLKSYLSKIFSKALKNKDQSEK